MDQANNDLRLLALCAVKGLSWDVIARQAQQPDGVDLLLAGQLVEDSDQARASAPVLRAAVSDLTRYLERARSEIARAEDAGAHLTTVLDADYPENLRVIYNAPPFLFHLGDIREDDGRAIAVVGTRHPSAEGIRRAERMAAGLVEAGVTVLSGMALGIDAAAHRATIANGGRTIAVMGTGILARYPKENTALADQIVATGGALVSQFWPSAGPLKYNFPRRNVVTSGLGQGTVVIEATHTSGAKMQARLALLHGKRVFLIQSLTTEGWARKYIEERGAIEVTDVRDVLANLRSTEQVRELALQRLHLAMDL
jgi:DNA processing protein